MRWHEITIHTREEVAELVANAFHEMGAGGVTIEESGTLAKERDTSLGQLYDTPLNDIPEGEAVVQAYFADPEDVGALIGQLEEHVRFVRDELEYDVGKATIKTREVDEEDWAHSWKQYYKPMRISDRLTIKPTWERYEPESADEIILELDPGMAFGTGTHPTTSLCLQTLEKAIEPGTDVIDVGTGSGILAIAAAKLGARRVLALDLDPVAVESATENVQLNGVGGIVAVMESDLLGVLRSAGLVAGGEEGSGRTPGVDVGALGVKLPVKLVVANILAEIILLFIQDVYDVLESGGTYITSGIYKNKADDVEKGLVQAGFAIERKERDQDWIAFVAKKP
ncbi:50S ribosomal protein L11 methyltransferase [Paenibacillus hemerocallicola]|jgi:ribosomal protein L11 methyltransferase|uniref:Ribosomal protein L11 methyltransferase n=1 Tax=Paenibacillus hemerocallicola TaxID=1172614 RepID=A0A5C4T6X5_9BACL|nr:50S ribosomal protein L11 methyltransferase [Paenibacillus hemerocallicola]TNJ64107.1 50S ribosomal protein L11 methyltransferase [Paenibacillus hemerocallicola]